MEVAAASAPGGSISANGDVIRTMDLGSCSHKLLALHAAEMQQFAWE
jgi:hypothetical protein